MVGVFVAWIPALAGDCFLPIMRSHGMEIKRHQSTHMTPAELLESRSAALLAAYLELLRYLIERNRNANETP